jgi:hypothetical protein
MHTSIYASYINDNTSIHLHLCMKSYVNDNKLIHLHLCMTSYDYDSTWHQSIDIKDNTWSINHYINILWQDIVPSTSILWHQWQHDPTISPFGIDGNTNIDVNTNNWWQHVDKALLFINSHLNHINVTICPPLTSMEKGHSLLGVAPPAWTLLGAAPPAWIPSSSSE